MEASKKRSALDAVHITFAVPTSYLYEEPTGEDDEVNKETRYQLHRYQGWKDQTLKEFLTEETLKEMEIEGDFDIIHRPDAWGHKSVRISDQFTLEAVKEYYRDKAGDCVLELKPCIPVWYQCIRLTEKEMDAMKKVVEGVAMRRLTKKQKRS